MPAFTTRPEITGNFGVVTSTHWIASAIGMAILEQGGNAFDAAVATGFALQVVEPHLNGPGGEVPLILAPADGPVVVICGQGTAPAAATIEAFAARDLEIIPGNGLLAATIPGAFDAWMLLLHDYGTLSLRQVLEPAIGLLTQGYPLVPNIVNTIASVAELFREEWHSSAAIWLPGGSIPAAGSFFTNPSMAATYQRLLNEAEAMASGREAVISAARKIWAQGFVAEAIDSFCRNTAAMDTSGRHHHGLLTGEDLATWQATTEQPVCYDYGHYTLCKTAAWGQGPVFLQQLALLKGFDLESLDATDPLFVHLVTEATKLAFADREAFYGDPDFTTVPLGTLLSDSYNDARRALIAEDASLALRPGEIAGHGGPVRLRARGSTPPARFDIGEPTVARFDEPVPAADGTTRGDTCHFDIIDRWGNMISGTPSGGWLQSSPVIPALGFCLGNRGQMFWLDPASPAALAPGKRPRTTLSPGLALRDDVPYLAFGTPGGDQQDQWALHLFLRHVHFGMNLQQAIDAPGFNTAHFPSSFYPRETDIGHLAIEGRFPEATATDLRRRGHRLVVDDDWCLGRMTAASRHGPVLRAAANPRFMQGYAIGR